MIILSNKARCLKCGDIIESTHRHDFVRCACGAIAIDGGTTYFKFVGDVGCLEDLSEWIDEEEDEQGDAFAPPAPSHRED